MALRGRDSRSRSALLQDLYRKRLGRVAPVENARMRERMSPYFNDTNARREADKGLRRALIIEAIRDLSYLGDLVTVEQISIRTGLNNRSIQSTMPYLVRSKQIERVGSDPYEIRRYRLPDGK